MRPSEYIALGIRLRPRQEFRNSRSAGAGCALTAFVDGVMGMRTERSSALVERTLILAAVPGLRRGAVGAPLFECPACQDVGIPYANNVFGAVVHLNDTHRWTRERIGEWLDAQVEPASTAEPEEELELITA